MTARNDLARPDLALAVEHRVSSLPRARGPRTRLQSADLTSPLVSARPHATCYMLHAICDMLRAPCSVLRAPCSILHATTWLTLRAMDASLTLRQAVTLGRRREDREDGHFTSKSGFITAASVRFGKVQRYNMAMWGWHLSSYSSPPCSGACVAASSQAAGGRANCCGGRRSASRGRQSTGTPCSQQLASSPADGSCPDCKTSELPACWDA